MPVEKADYINQLDQEAPQGGESISEGDDHIRAIKRAVFKSFPNIGSEVTVTPTDLNGVPKIRTDLDALMANNGIFAVCRYDGSTETYKKNIQSVVPLNGNAGYRVTFIQPTDGFDEHYAVLAQAYAVGGNHTIVTVTGQSSTFVDLAVIEFDFSSQQWRVPVSSTEFSLVLLDLQQL